MKNWEQVCVEWMQNIKASPGTQGQTDFNEFFKTIGQMCASKTEAKSSSGEKEPGPEFKEFIDLCMKMCDCGGWTLQQDGPCVGKGS